MTTMRTANRKLMTVGEMSRRTGLSIKTLRQYADLGLVYTAGRSASGYRLFDTDALWCVQMIGMLRALGLTVAEIRELTDVYLRRDGTFGWRLAERVHLSRQRLDARIAELQQTVRRIDEFESAQFDAFAAEGNVCLSGDPRCHQESV